MRRNTSKQLWFIVFCFLLLFPKTAYANVAMPMFIFNWLAMAWALIPIVLIEAIVLMMILKISFWRATSVSFWANARSTIIGIPFSWLISLSILIVGALISWVFKIPVPDSQFSNIPIQAVWILPTHDGSDRYMPIAFALGLIPAFFVSIWIEFGVAKKKLQELDAQVIHRAVQVGNVITYTILLILVFVMFFLDLFS